MTMKVGSRQVDGVTIVDCSGRITLGEGSVILRDTVRDLLSKGNKKIVLNLADVNYIDSSGMRAFRSRPVKVGRRGIKARAAGMKPIQSPLWVPSGCSAPSQRLL